MMNQLSNETQPPYGNDQGLEAQQQPPIESAAPQQEMPTDFSQQEWPQENYQQGLPPLQGGDQQYPPTESYQQYGYQPYPPGSPPSYSYQQLYVAPPMGEVGPFERTGMGMRARTAGMLCYLFAWVTGLVFFLLEKESRFVRFHAMQSILFFGSLSLLEAVFSNLPYFGPIAGALGLVSFIGWLVLIVKAGRGQYYKLPVFGDLAERLIDQIKV